MSQATTGQSTRIGPKKRRHFSFDESLDEPPGLIEKETVDIEEAVPADENEPVEKGEDSRPPETPAFEE
jgi:hypothetical protein